MNWLHGVCLGTRRYRESFHEVAWISQSGIKFICLDNARNINSKELFWMGLQTIQVEQVADCYGTMQPNGERHSAWKESLANRRRPERSNEHKEETLTPKEILKEYLRDTSLHGVKYTIGNGLLMYRLLWIAAVLACVVCALYFMAKAWINFFESPILTTVRNAYYPLYDIPFPAVTICPGFNIKKRIGLDTLYSKYHTNYTGTDLNSTFIHLMRALTFFRYPYYHLMNNDLNEIDNPKMFDTLNMTEFMLSVLPTNEEMFHSCKWKGDEVNCSEIFELQRYEGGFCYSFNSLTSIRCRRSTEECQKTLRNNSASGTTSGLEVFLNNRDIQDHLGEGAQDAKGVRVMIHDPSELPQAGTGLFIMDNKPKVGIIKLFASITTSSEAMRSMAPKDRNCYFEDEISLVITHGYSQDNCLIECRLRYIERRCECQPYFFSFPEDHWNDCTVAQFPCIIGETNNLKFTHRILRDLGPESSASCPACLPSCNNINYDIDATFTEESKPINESTIGYLNVYYKEQSAVEYYRVMAIDGMQLLVSVGGIAGLFLGFSLLSLFEICYFFCRWITVVLKNVRGSKQSVNTSVEQSNSPSPAPHYPEYTFIS